MLMVPDSVLWPVAMEVAVEAESGQNEELSKVVTLATCGKPMKPSGDWTTAPSCSVAPL